MDEQTFINIIKSQPGLCAAYKIKQQKRLDEKNAIIRVKMQAARALKPKKERKKYTYVYYGNLFRNPEIN